MIHLTHHESMGRIAELYSFLNAADHKWVRTFFANEKEFTALPDDEDFRMLIYQNDRSEICCAVLLLENAILTAAFSDETPEVDYDSVLNDVLSLVRQLGYTCIYYGDGYDSYGLFTGDGDVNAFGDFLKRNGFVVESVDYDMRHETADVKRSGFKGFHIQKTDQTTLGAYGEDILPAGVRDALDQDFRRFPGDSCFAVFRDADHVICGYAFLDPQSSVIDQKALFLKKSSDHKSADQELMFAMASELSADHRDTLTELHVDQLASQKIPHRFQVCGKYETLVRELL